MGCPTNRTARAKTLVTIVSDAARLLWHPSKIRSGKAVLNDQLQQLVFDGASEATAVPQLFNFTHSKSSPENAYYSHGGGIAGPEN